jgi:hypothetical protein
VARSVTVSAKAAGLEGPSAACYSVAVTARHLALAALALAVLGMGVYLFIQVRSTPAQADVTGPAHPVGSARASSGPVEATPPPPGDARATPGSGSGPIAHGPELAGHPPRLGGEGGDVTPDDPTRANPRLDSIMDQANKAYDRQEFDEAKAIAGKVLSKDPTNIRMMRIMVSSSCIDGDTSMAQKYYELLPKFDREQMRQRCDRYGVAFKEPVQ